MKATYTITFESLSTMKAALLILEAAETEGVKANKRDPESEKVNKDDPDDFNDDLDEAEELYEPTPAELKGILTSYRDEKGSDELKKLLKIHGAANLKGLKRDEWPAIYAAAQNELGGDDLGEEEEEEDDDLFDGDEAEELEEVDVNTVKAAVQAYAKTNGLAASRDILKKNGLNTVRGLGSAKQDVLNKIYKAVS